MGRKNKSADAAAAAETADPKKKGFIRKSMGRLMFLGAIGAAFKYFADENKVNAAKTKVQDLAANAKKKGPGA